MGLLAGESDDPEHDSQHRTSVLGYGHTAFAAFLNTAATAFHERSVWTAAALLDLPALLAVWRQHQDLYAEAAAAAALRSAAADPANPATHAVPPPAFAEELPLLQVGAAHAKAAYGHAAAAGLVSSASGYLQLITVGQITGKAPRHISAAQHLAALHQLTGCPPGDVVAAQWQAHLHRPAWYAAIDRHARQVVVCVRGTIQLGDFLTVLDAVPQPVSLCGTAGHVHGGFLAAAHNLVPPVAAALRAAARECPGWPVVVCGHSLGGGVAAVVTTLLVDLRQHADAAAEQGVTLRPDEQQQVEALRALGSVRCIGIGAAAAFCHELGMACRPHVTSVLYG